MSTTPSLGLPLIAAAQAQKHVTHNEAIHALDALLFLNVLDRDLTAPPASPPAGARYLVASGASGGWVGQAGRLACLLDGGWRFFAPNPGWIARIADEGVVLVFDGTSWVDLVAAGGLSTLQNLVRLGVGTTADAANPIAAKLNNVLWTARTVAEGGDGDLRYKLNKESAADTLSLLFQSGWSGRAEIGLVGDDDLTVKVSADGTAWTDALRVARATGTVAIPRLDPARVARGNADYVIQPGDRVVALTAAFTAPRVFTLPSASAVPAGASLVIIDEAGAISATNTLTVQRAGSDTISGASLVLLTTARGFLALVSDGATRWTLASAPYRGPSHQIFTTSGTFHKSTLPSGVTHVVVHVTGAGGGGGGGHTGLASRGTGGGGGGYALRRLMVASLADNETVTVGAGGAGGNAGVPGTNGAVGGSSSFGTHVSAGGGSGGIAGNAAAQGGASGGSGASGDLNLTGSSSRVTDGGGTVLSVSSGGDAAGPFGGRGGTANVAAPGLTPGGGGACGNHTGGGAGAGAPGLVIVTW